MYIKQLDAHNWVMAVDVDLEGSDFEGLNFTPVQIDRSEHDWFFVSLKGKIFEIRCGPKNLEEGLSIFLRHVNEPMPSDWICEELGMVKRRGVYRTAKEAVRSEAFRDAQNRGANVIDILDVIGNGNSGAVPVLIRDSKRLWQGRGQVGPLKRCNAEAALFQQGQR